MGEPDATLEVVGPVEPRRLDSVVSLRFETDVAAALRDRANSRDEKLSDLLRVGAEMALAASDAELDRWMRCPSCDGSGKRKWRTGGGNG